MKAIGDVGAGHTLGRYELLVPIAKGGMAVVWAARMKGSRGFQKLVAIKSMLPSLSDDDGSFEEMFLAEAQLAAQIRHPNICEILDLGEQDGVLFIVQEWVDGEPLGTIHKAARDAGENVPIAVATRIGFHVATGLHAAHELRNQETGEPYGLVHRDVSPQNILITADGVVKVVDFGVAKATAGVSMGRTAVGQMKGKVTYMAPEQARGIGVDRRADIFALGIVLYQLVTNRHPFKGDTPLKTLDRICDPTPVVPPITYQPTCHPALSAAIVRALEKDTKKRFATMLEFAQALEGVLSKTVTRGNDLSSFVKGLVGERSEKRRELIREALRTADDRKDRPGVSGLRSALAAPAAPSAEDTGKTPGASSISTPGARASHTPAEADESSAPSRPPAETLEDVQQSEASKATKGGTVLMPARSDARAPLATLPIELMKPRPLASAGGTPKTSEAKGSSPKADEEPKSSPPPSAGEAKSSEAKADAEPKSSPAPKVGEAKSSPPPKAATKSAPPSPAAAKSERPSSIEAKPAKSRAWIAAVLFVLVAGAIAVVAFTTPGALDRFRPGKNVAPAPAVRPKGTSPEPPQHAAPSVTATAAASTAPAEPSAAPAAEASAEPAPSASASASTGFRPGMPLGKPWPKPLPAPMPMPAPPPPPPAATPAPKPSGTLEPLPPRVLMPVPINRDDPL